VAWFGGPSWGVSVGFGGGFGGYGWCPLGYGEPYVPWYGVSRGYFNRVNITNTHITNVNITNIYNNTYINNHPAAEDTVVVEPAIRQPVAVVVEPVIRQPAAVVAAELMDRTATSATRTRNRQTA